MKKSFADYTPAHLTPRVIEDTLSGEPIDESTPKQIADLEYAKIDINKRIWDQLVVKTPYLLKAILEIASVREEKVEMVRNSIIVGLSLGYALGCAQPITEEALSKFDAAVAKLMDRREHGCDDPLCLACTLRKAIRGKHVEKEVQVN
jgi:hypothetical protein